MLFETGLNQISPRMFSSLNAVAQVIKEVNMPVRIVGYSDATPAVDGETNLMLSLKRRVGEELSDVCWACSGRPDDRGRARRRALAAFLSKAGDEIAVSDDRRRHWSWCGGSTRPWVIRRRAAAVMMDLGSIRTAG